MARPKLGESESKRLQMVITENELEAIDEWQHDHRIASRSEAIRRLIQIGIRTGGPELAKRIFLQRGPIRELQGLFDAAKDAQLGSDADRQIAVNALLDGLPGLLDSLVDAFTAMMSFMDEMTALEHKGSDDLPRKLTFEDALRFADEVRAEYESGRPSISALVLRLLQKDDPNRGQLTKRLVKGDDE